MLRRSGSVRIHQCSFVYIFTHFIWTFLKRADLEREGKLSVVCFYNFYGNEWLSGEERQSHTDWLSTVFNCMIMQFDYSNYIRQWRIQRRVKCYSCCYYGKDVRYLNTFLHSKSIQTPVVNLSETKFHA